MNKETSIAIVLMIMVISIFGIMYAIGNAHTQQDQYNRTSGDLDTRLIYATMDGMETKYSSQDPVITCKEYITCTPESQYDYIMNGKISLLNDYGARITYSFSAYIVKNGESYSVVDSIVY